MRVLLADDQPEVRSALRLLLEQEGDLTVVGESAECEDLLERARLVNPDLLLLDWELPCLQVANLLSALRFCYPDLRVIVMSGRPEARRAALAAGATAFVSKGDPPERMLAAVREMMDTERV